MSRNQKQIYISKQTHEIEPHLNKEKQRKSNPNLNKLIPKS